MATFEPYLELWGLKPDGAPIVTANSRLLPVLRQGEPAMLKLAVELEEAAGAALMEFWNGDGAARVLARQDDALLLERATGIRSLAAMSCTGEDDEACRILCQVTARLHAARARPLPDLVPLSRWFAALAPAAAGHGGIFSQCAAAAEALLAGPGDTVALHGDIHHANVLDFGPRGWLAIDPKGLVGERGFDYANLFCNPDTETAVARFPRRLEVVAAAAGLERTRLLRWILAWTGLSAAWLLADGETPAAPLAIAELAAAALGEGD